MLKYVFAFIVIISIICAFFTGSITALSEAVMDGAGRAVSVSISLLGAMCLWSGILQVLNQTGVLRGVTRTMKPILRLIFPDAAKRDNGLDEICAALSANILGMGNAATPMALKAMKKLHENNSLSDTASDDMVSFTVISTASFALFPTTVIALRSTFSGANTFIIILPVWICSALGMVCAVFFAKTLRVFWRSKN